MPVFKFRLPIFRPHRHVEPEDRAALTQRDFERVFQSQEGARVLAEILRMSDAFLTVSPGVTDRDFNMIEGRRELAMMIFEKAGYLADKLPLAMVADDFREALKDGDYERDTDEPERRDGEPDFSKRGY